jgi:geranylgeranyl pyrophosphate synthase
LSAPTLDEYLTARRHEVEDALVRYLPKPPQCPPLVFEAMQYSLMAGGKRLRPILTLASAEAVAAAHGAPLERARALAMPAACAIEMIHTYSLIHDDLPAMDDDVLRRGRPTLHVVYGEGFAILAGDSLHTEAFALLARGGDLGDWRGDLGDLGDLGALSDAEIAVRRLKTIYRIAKAAGPEGMAGGQAIDLEAVTPVPGRAAPPPLDAKGVAAMHARKTGAIIRASAAAGAVMAGADESEVDAIDAYAREIGLAFQIVDDILDVEGASAALGKTPGKDAAAGKPTYPALFGLERSRVLADECLARAHAALASAGFSSSRLGAIANWVVRRRS